MSENAVATANQYTSSLLSVSIRQLDNCTYSWPETGMWA